MVNVRSQIYEACGMLKERKFEIEFVIDVVLNPGRGREERYLVCPQESWRKGRVVVRRETLYRRYSLF
ncbi:MAG: hypothetical protein OCU22_08210 [Canidatus Methanoxibalbensis ujae]|nr:hypothetical protein [Candidatus Methanoxibalbensis ujae]